MSVPEPELVKLEQAIGHTFTDRSILVEALTHKSYYFENKRTCMAHNERLEFLGDSVLGICVATYLFRQEQKLNESMMAKVKSYVVKGSVISEVARELELGAYLLMGKGEEDTGGRSKSSILTNAMEAVIGAVYVDEGPKAAWDLVLRFFHDRLDAAISSGDFQDYKTDLQAICQEIDGTTPVYRLADEGGLEHEKVFVAEVLVGSEVRGTGRGKSKKKAEQAAALQAIQAHVDAAESK